MVGAELVGALVGNALVGVLEEVAKDGEAFVGVIKVVGSLLGFNEGAEEGQVPRESITCPNRFISQPLGSR